MIHQSILVSFPRSGRDLLQRWLNGYFQDDLWFIGDHNIKKKKLAIDDPSLKDYHLIFSHNFYNIGVSNRKTIILLRHPIYSLISWWEYWGNKGSYVPDTKAKRIEFKKFIFQRFDYWKAMFEAGVAANTDKPDDVLFLLYEDIIKSPEATLKKVIMFISDEKKPNTELIEDVIKRNKKRGDPRKNKKKSFEGMRSLKTSPFYCSYIKEYDPIWEETDELTKKHNVKIGPM